MSTPPASRNTVSSAISTSTFYLLPSTFYLLPSTFYLLGPTFNPRPRIFQRHGTVEDRRRRTGIRVDAEIADAFELIARAGRGRGGGRLHLRVAHHFERRRVQC